MPTQLISGTSPTFVDNALSQRLEAAEVAMHRGLVQSLLAAQPESGAEWLPVAGGCAAYLGGNISPSRAVGLGMEGPVSLAEVEAMEDFYRAREMPARILVSPFADPTLLEHLASRGFQLVELDSMLVRSLPPGETFPALPEGVAVERAAAKDASRWVQVSLEGMLETSEPPANIVQLFAATFHNPSCVYFFAHMAGKESATAALDMQSGLAYFFATSTLASARRRGLQGALIAARLAFAQAAGCDLCFSRTAAGSSSQRNLEKWGFRSVYSRASLIKRFA